MLDRLDIEVNVPNTTQTIIIVLTEFYAKVGMFSQSCIGLDFTIPKELVPTKKFNVLGPRVAIFIIDCARDIPRGVRSHGYIDDQVNKPKFIGKKRNSTKRDTAIRWINEHEY